MIRQSVTDCLLSMGIEVCDEPNEDIVLRLVHLSASGPLPDVHHSRTPIVFIGDVTQSGLVDLAAASISFPFLSNDLRKTVGRILQINVRDSAAYDLADRPVPVFRKSADPATPTVKASPVNVARESSVLLKPSVVMPTLETQADLPRVSNLEEALPPIDYAKNTVTPQTLEPQTSTPMMAAGALETISEAYIEKVVWEVVPRLAERILREEIARILREESNKG